MKGIDRPFQDFVWVSDVSGTIKAILVVANEPEHLTAAIPNAQLLRDAGGKFLFDKLKNEISYKDDPKNFEYIQGAKSLLKSLQGDCDCFTCLMVSVCLVAQLPFNILLFGNTKDIPTHIAIQIFDPKLNQYCTFDLTTPTYNVERGYKYKQLVPISIK